MRGKFKGSPPKTAFLTHVMAENVLDEDDAPQPTRTIPFYKIEALIEKNLGYILTPNILDKVTEKHIF